MLSAGCRMHTHPVKGHSSGQERVEEPLLGEAAKANVCKLFRHMKTRAEEQRTWWLPAAEATRHMSRKSCWARCHWPPRSRADIRLQQVTTSASTPAACMCPNTCGRPLQGVNHESCWRNMELLFQGADQRWHLLDIARNVAEQNVNDTQVADQQKEPTDLRCTERKPGSMGFEVQAKTVVACACRTRATALLSAKKDVVELVMAYRKNGGIFVKGNFLFQ